MTSVSGFFGRVLSRLSPQRSQNSNLGHGDQGAEVSGSSDSRSPSPSPRSTQPPNVNIMGDEPTPVVTRSRTRARNKDAQTQRASTDSTDLTLPNGPQAQDTVVPANTNRNGRKSRTRRVRNIQTDTANDNSQQQNGSNSPHRLSTGSGNGNTSPLSLSTGSGNGNTSPLRLSSGSGNGNTSPFRFSTGSVNGNTSPLRLSTGSINGNTSPLRLSAGSGNGNTSPFRLSTGSGNGNGSPLSIGSGSGSSPPVNGNPQFLTVDSTRSGSNTGDQMSPSQDNGSSLSDSSSRSKLVEGDDKNASPPEEHQSHDLEAGDPDENDNNNPECAVCLLPCIHPVQLPCAHIFCYLCVKGVANQSKRCALCRQEIPTDFLNNPALLRLDSLVKEWQLQEGYQWYYEGRNGWWQYDERTSREMEEKYANEESAFELLIAGFLYVIDLKNMIQIRRNDPTRRRRIKRDSANIPDKKGVAGLKVSTASVRTPERRQGDGGEIASPAGATAATQTVVPSAPEADALSVNSAKAALKEDSPAAPTNSPEHPESGSGKNDSRSESEEDLSNQMTTLRMARERHQMQIPRMRRRRRHRRRHHHHHGAHHFLDTPSTSSDSDYDY